MVNNDDKTNNNEEERRISLYYQNCRGICSKQRKFFPALNASDYDIVVFVETWLTDKHSTNEFFPSNFDTYRCDRANGKKGGGVSISVRKGLCGHECVLLSNNLNLEYICLKLTNRKNSVFVYALYVPPMTTDEASKRSIYFGHLDNIERIERKDDDILVIVRD